ncbi:hypothetical protein [Absidia glauca]|uniref:Reverse transcriptase domain-containing protein n=1 Tax=Absidia glauca TaxID=4829 RepID=A0A168M342_ABSGL|nr:hypothetical protein [Absidia glauca]
MDPKAIAARQFRKNSAPSASPTTDSMLIDVLAADKRSHSVDYLDEQKRTKIQDTRQPGDYSIINVEDITPTTKKTTKPSRVKIPSQAPSDQSLDVASLVNKPVFNLSLAQIASHPTWRSQIKDALTKRYTKKVDSALTTGKPLGNCAPWTMGSVNSNNTPIVLDGGSSVDILCLDFVKALGIKELRSSSTVINVANGSSAYPVGEVESLSVSLGNRTLSIKNALVFEHLPCDCLLGRNSLHLLGVTTDWSEHIWMIDWSPLEVKYTRAPTVPRNDASSESDEDGTSDEEDTDRSLDGYLICLDSVSPNNSNSDAPESFAATPDYADQDRLGDLLDQIAANNLLSTEQRVALTSLVRDNSSVFGTSYHHLSKTNLLELEVNTGEAAPIYRKPHLNLSFKEREYLKNELEQMVANGILIPSTYGANSGWSFPVRFVPKKGGDKRLVTQFMALNAVTVRDTFPLPSINGLLDQLSGASWL